MKKRGTCIGCGKLVWGERCRRCAAKAIRIDDSGAKYLPTEEEIYKVLCPRERENWKADDKRHETGIVPFEWTRAEDPGELFMPDDRTVDYGAKPAPMRRQHDVSARRAMMENSGVEKLVSRKAHNLEIAGSNPAPAN